MKKKGSLCYIFIVTSIFIALLAFTLFMGVNRSNSQFSFIFNLIFLVSMFLLVFGFILTNVKKAINIRNQLKNAIDKLKGEDWENISFEMSELETAYENYQNEMERLSQAESVDSPRISCDIEEYIYPQLLNNIIKKPLCESISGTMTGLGLLGTFLGLIIGLKDFSTDYNEIQNSILMLLNGIKMSFLTSVYGVLFSLVFNRIYRGCYAEMMNTLDEFYQEFHKKNQPSQNDINSRLITALERTMIPELKQTNISVDKLYSSIESGVTDQITSGMKSMTDRFLSHMEKIQQMQKELQDSMVDSINRHLDQAVAAQKKSLQSMVSEIENYLTKSESSQQDKLRTMVEQYLKTMNQEILGGEFEELRKTLGMINESNALHYKRVAELSKQIEASGQALRELSDQYTENINNFQGYVTAIQGYQSEITASNTELVAHMSEMQKGYNVHNDTLTTLIDKMKDLTAIVVNLDQICKQMDVALNDDQKNRFEWTSAVTELIQKLRSTIDSVSITAIETMKADRAAAESARNETMLQIDANLQLLRDFSQQCDHSADELGSKYIEVTERLNNGLETSFSALDSETAKIIAYFNNLLIDIKDSADYIPIRLKQERKAEFEEWYKERQRLLEVVRGYRSQADEASESKDDTSEESPNEGVPEPLDSTAVLN